MPLVLPWLNPFAPGPTPSVGPLLFSWLCAAIVALLWVGWGRSAFAGSAARCVANAWLVAALLSCLVAMAQYFGYSASLGPWVSPTGLGEAYGNLRQRNQFATLTSIGLLALLWLVAQPRGLRTPWWLAAGALLALGNAASGSRTGLMQWVVIVVLLAVWRRSLERRVWVAGVAAVGFYLLAVRGLPWLLEIATGFQAPGLLGRLQEEVGCSSRRVLWANVLHLIAQKPWLGWGWGELDYAHFITLYPGERFCDILDNAHNLPLHLAVELGVPVAILVCALLLRWVWVGRPWRVAEPTAQLAWGVLAVVGLHSLVEYPLWYGPFQMAVGLSVWLLIPPGSLASVDERNRGLAPVFVGGVAIFTIAVLAYAAWDYRRVSQLYLAQEARLPAYQTETLAKVRDSRLFRDQVEFAELTTTPITAVNAELMHALALDLLHFSPEPRVIEKVIESAVALHRDEEALWYLVRYRAAFAQAHANWAAPLRGDIRP